MHRPTMTICNLKHFFFYRAGIGININFVHKQAQILNISAVNKLPLVFLYEMVNCDIQALHGQEYVLWRQNAVRPADHVRLALP